MRALLTLLIAGVLGIGLQAQSTSLANSMDIYVFPSNGQDKETQETDELACYKWAMDQTGYNPVNPPSVQAQEVETGPDGSAIRGAAGGAAAGAAIGAIAGDTGEGAAIGAVVGALRGRRAKRYNDAAKQQQNNALASAQNEAMLNDFKRAFTVCLEGKGYTAK